MTFDRLRQLPREEITFGRLLHAGWRRIAAIRNDVSYRLQAGPGSENDRQLSEFKDLYLGERCFILGNGPSLAKTDLSRLGDARVFGLNRIYLMFGQSDFRPGFYVCMNGLVLDQSADHIRQLDVPRFINWSHHHLFKESKGINFLREVFTPSFSTDLRNGVWVGATVTYVALQVAYFMGFEEVILLGVDHNYRAKGTPHSIVVGEGEEVDHFVPNYFPTGFRWQLPDLRTSEIAYRLARNAYEADGRRVVDATIDGQLDIFPKADFNELTSGPARGGPAAEGSSRPRVHGAQPEGPSKAFSKGRAAVSGRSEPLVSIGIVTWNSAKYLPDCLRAIQTQTHPNLEVILVDNASGDDSRRLVGELAPEADLILNRRNEGYCRAHNQILGRARGDYYLPLNPDVVMQPEFVERIVAVLESKPDCGSVNGKFWLAAEGSDRILDSTGLFIDRARHQYLRGHGQLDEGQYEAAGEIFGADGAGPLYRRSCLDQAAIQGQVYDESYFGYHEDVDLAWRIRLLGWKSWYEPSALAVHDRSFKPGIRRTMPPHLRRLAVRNRYLTILKNEAPETFRRDWWRILFYDARILGYVLLFEQSSLMAYPMLWGTRSRLRQWREDLWTKVRVSAEERRGWFQ